MGEDKKVADALTALGNAKSDKGDHNLLPRR